MATTIAPGIPIHDPYFTEDQARYPNLAIASLPSSAPFKHLLIIVDPARSPDTYDAEDDDEYPPNSAVPSETYGDIEGEDRSAAPSPFPDQDDTQSLSESVAREPSPAPSDTFARTIPEEVFTKFYESLSAVVDRSRDIGGPNEPVDAVYFRNTGSGATWSPKTFEILDGISPTTLIVQAWGSHCDLSLLDNMKNPWSLKALVLANVSSYTTSPGVTSRVCGTLEALTLHYTSGLTFWPTTEGGDSYKSLKHLHIIGNDAFDTFCDTLKANPGLASRLETLHLESVVYSEDYRGHPGQEYKLLLQTCTSLRNITLIVGDFPTREGEQNLETHFSGIPGYLPASVEVLKVKGPFVMVTELEAWNEAVGNADWLPRLKSVYLRMDVPRFHFSQDVAFTEEFVQGVAKKVDEFLTTLKERRPDVEVLRE